MTLPVRHSRESGNPWPHGAPGAGSPLLRGRRGVGARREAGFSLLEVLVAFVVLALVGTMLSQLYAASLRNAGAAQDWSRLVLVAEGQLAAAAAVVPLKEGSNAGSEDDGRITWTARVEPYVPPDTSPELGSASAQMPLALMRVTVTATMAPEDAGSGAGAGNPGRSVSLSTIKLYRKDLT